ncbi:MAG: septum formation initiator family protein [Alphaproteobacteria bacterium]|nr:septum formation initiator family protein [Alphaproteobacteria bacterium]MBT4085713.1 septum formation initiator family protein [Alphaproteobacteria bacterium]MBT4543292.1 septum formation initiator family protein [Alphaproteobacteria bacterium]MBT7747219.1 septum formation initiator family protein [Alphaproteobacteria bacterium]
MHEIRRRARHAVVPLICTSVLGYFGYHAVQGDRGMSAWVNLGQQIKGVEAQIAVNKTVLDRMEHRVSLLRSNGLSRDMLDERSRQVLGLAHPDELIILGK